MHLKPGQHAVPFTVETLQGETISLESFYGKPLLLMFFRYSSCPMCNLRLHEFAQHYPRLHNRGLEVVAFFHSSPKSVRADAGSRRYPFYLVADPEFSIYRSYGVETSWPKFLLSTVLPSFYLDWLRSMRYGFWGGVAWQMAKMPADFLIDPDSRIIRAHYGQNIGDHLAVSEIEKLLHVS